LKEKDLTQNKEIIKLLDSLKGRRFKLSRPLPRCILGSRYNELVKKFKLPRDCFDCRELFSVENSEIISCEPIGKKGPKIQYMESRNQIWEFFNTLRLQKEPNNTCKNCLYYKRKQCDGLCYR